jgi:hypothetical protein
VLHFMMMRIGLKVNELILGLHEMTVVLVVVSCILACKNSTEKGETTLVCTVDKSHTKVTIVCGGDV